MDNFYFGISFCQLSKKAKSKMGFIHPGVITSEESYINNAIDTGEVRGLREELEYQSGRESLYFKKSNKAE